MKSKRVLSLILALLLLVGFLPIRAEAAENYTRIAGSNRYETAFAAADALKDTLGVEKFPNIVIASGKGYADALAGSYLAAEKNAPILLVNENMVNQVAAYVKGNLASGGTVYLLGGVAAVPEKMEAALSGYSVNRLAGANRYETNLNLLWEIGTGNHTVLICTGRGFADSLSVSALGLPIVLVGKTLTDSQRELLLRTTCRFVIIGGESAVSRDVEDELRTMGGVTRLGGSNRYETSVMVAEYFFETPDAAVLAYAKNFPDGLCGGPLAYAMGAPLVLTAAGSEKAANSFAASHGISDGVVLGGNGLISDEVATGIFNPEESSALQEKPIAFPGGDYITTSAVSIDSGKLVFDIGENVFVPGHLDKVAKSMTTAIEKVSGVRFDGTDYANLVHTEGKSHIQISRDFLYAGQDWYEGSDDSELGSAYADALSHANVSPGDLFLYENYAIVHELSHVLMFKQIEWSNSSPINEGFAEFTTFLALEELMKTDPTAAFYLGRRQQSVWNMHIYDYSELYKKPLEHWLENPYEYSGNGNYVVGFRFMWYLHDVYGDYSKWMSELDRIYSFKQYGGHTMGTTDQVPMEKQIEAFKSAYGEDVLDNFYPWLQQNEGLFDSEWGSEYWDISELKHLNWYPSFTAVSGNAQLHMIAYEDLYLNLETIKHYVTAYKKLDVSGMKLLNPDRITINLYKADGTYVTVSGKNEIPLDGISYIKLVGSGKVSNLEVVGFQ